MRKKISAIFYFNFHPRSIQQFEKCHRKCFCVLNDRKSVLFMANRSGYLGKKQPLVRGEQYPDCNGENMENGLSRCSMLWRHIALRGNFYEEEPCISKNHIELLEPWDNIDLFLNSSKSFTVQL